MATSKCDARGGVGSSECTTEISSGVKWTMETVGSLHRLSSNIHGEIVAVKAQIAEVKAELTDVKAKLADLKKKVPEEAS